MRAQLAQALENLSADYKVAPLLEMAASHYLHVLHLDIPDHLDLRVRLPITLLKLNQDERCVAFITHWMRREEDPVYRESNESLHAGSALGDWIYGTADCYADIFGVVDPADPEHLFQPHLIALCIVKMRIIAKHKMRCLQLQSFRATRSGQLLGDNVELIERYVVGDQTRLDLIGEQEQQVDFYLDTVSVADPLLLALILNPDKTKREEVVHWLVLGFDAHSWLSSCRSLFESVGAGIEQLQWRVGPRHRHGS
ncbi:hypothetical protein FGB62_130g016 [Gracilaria domingensis]|nr:hypothetical protein FGB62_130g016 [Gracilaria domingensis]